MSKFSSRPVRANSHGVVQSEGSPSGRTYNGADGYARDDKSELFLLAITNMVSEKTFYESVEERDDRFENLIHQMTIEDAEWMRGFIPWLRNEANMRSASLVAAAGYVKAGGDKGRQVVAAVCQRADEPSEMLAYWHQRHGRKLPMAIKRGVADAVTRLYTERNHLKYDGQAKAWRFADVIELVHPKPQGSQQAALFKYLLDKRHQDSEAASPPRELGMLRSDSALQHLEPEGRRESLANGGPAKAGWSWERLSGWLPGGMDKEAWEAVIPQMGYMALLRNLRNFDETGVGVEAYQRVVAKLTDADEVKRSRQFPSRFLSAYKSLSSERWKYPLERALDMSLDNVPALGGKTLILVDVSGSMVSPLSSKSDLMRWEAASVFAAALAKRADYADLHAYSSHAEGRTLSGQYIKTARRSQVWVNPGASVFSIVEAVRNCASFGGGTETWEALGETYASHDRVIILTDEQASGPSWRGGASDPGQRAIPLIYTFNLAGYQYGHGRTGDRGRYTFGGFSDHGLRAIPMIEQARDQVWPWQVGNID